MVCAGVVAGHWLLRPYLRLVAQRLLAIIGLTVGLMTVKALILYVLARLNRCSHGSAVNLARFISQGGEFAFVLFGVAAGSDILDARLLAASVR